MTRFIIVTFLFLGFAFYELSGGADFDAEETRLSRIELPAELPEERIAAAAPNAPLPEEVTRVSLNLSSVNDVLRPDPTLRTKRAVARVGATPDDATVALSDEEPVVILPSLLVDSPVITPVDFSDDSTPAPVFNQVAADQPAADVRQVTGTRVNVRSGPGTGFGVVNSLSQGAEVEVLQDPGNGWVRLRPVGGGPVGWMADFLLSQG